MIEIIIIFIIDLMFMLVLLKEIFNLRDFKEAFKCDRCGAFNIKTGQSISCTSCNKKLKAIDKQWEHFILFTMLIIFLIVSEINTKNKVSVFSYKDYVKPFKLEIAICSLSVIIITTYIILQIWRIIL